jgi:hypothetical protein
MLGYWPYATHKKTFFYIFVETPTSQLDINMKMESSKPHPPLKLERNQMEGAAAKSHFPYSVWKKSYHL